jgi:hypothetical protein
VFRNLVKGLDAIGYPYSVNHALNSTRRLWIHDDHVALKYLSRSHDAAAVVGPNLFVMPDDIPSVVDLRGCLYVHPCVWATNLWREAGFDACPVAAWPVGIDLDEFSPSAAVERNAVLVYHKERPESQLGNVVAAIRSAGHTVQVIRYGHYVESELVEAASSASVVVWHGCHESQGIALQETLALDVPIVLMDVTRLSQAVGTYPFGTGYDDFRVTAAPYWDDRCGVRVYTVDEVVPAVEHVLSHRSEFAPREFVRESLSLEKQARAFVGLWEHFGLTLEEGLSETPRSVRAWSEPFSERAGRFAKHAKGALARRLGVSR